MDLQMKITEIAEKIPQQIDHIQTEEAAKNAFVMPFISALGYDIFNPAEVVPEYIADIGNKKGEKVDYAIMKEGKPVILFECKWCGRELDQSNAAQLRRYFHSTEARIAILTNGLAYEFYSDLDKPNVMDDKPFMKLDLTNIEESLINELKKLSKSSFELDQMLTIANDLKYVREIKHILSEEMDSPSPDFVKFFANQVYPGRLMPTVLEQFSGIIQKAFKQFVADNINDRLKSALTDSSKLGDQLEASEQPASSEEPEAEDDGIVTTVEEVEGFHIVRAILREVLPAQRIVYRDTKSYFGILLDDNNRKPICRLHFNTKQKYLGIIDKDKQESRKPIDDLSDIYQFADDLKNTIAYYD